MSHVNDPNVDQSVDALSESVTEVPLNGAGQMTNQQMDNLIVREPDHLQAPINRPAIPTQYFDILIRWYWLMMILYSFGIIYNWYYLIFLLFGVIADAILTDRNQSGVKLGKSRPFHNSFNANHNNHAAGRIAHPTDEDVIYSPTVTPVDDTPIGIEDTQPHDMVILVNLQHPGTIIINENGDFNEDVTLYNNQDDQAIPQIINNGLNARVMTNGDGISQDAVDDLTRNINPLDSTESQDDTYSSDSRDEDDQIVSSGSSCDADDEYDSGDDISQTGQALSNAENPSNHAQNESHWNEPAHVHEQSTGTLIATEVEPNINAPTEDALPLHYPTNIFTPKPSSPVGSNLQSDEESDHGSYSGGDYVYEYRDRLSDIRSNLSELHQLEWINNATSAVIIQLSLYNPNVQLFTSVTFLIEFLSTGGIYPQIRIEPIHFYGHFN